MADTQVQRRLAAILAADVVGSTRLMEQDEAGTVAALKERRTEILEPLVAAHHGRIVKVMGDGVLVEFASAVNAVACAVELQDRMTAANHDLADNRRIVLRIGVNLGDVVVEDGDLYGDGVIIAVRLEGIAEPGAILVSGSAYDQVRNKVKAAFDNLGAQELKNIAEPVRVYRVQSAPAATAPSAEPPPLPAMPSIAVLPFTNISNDAEQDAFCDGLTEDLITDISRTPGLFVIVRNSTFAYKGKNADARRIARDLGVRYLLEGSARRAAGRVRINAQLIDAVGGGHLWAERFDRGLDDIFAMQDEVTGKIVEALVGRLTAAPARQRPANLEAYDLCVRGRLLVAQSPQAAREARLLLQRAIALDPTYAEAHRWLARYLWEAWVVWAEPMEPHRSQALAMAEKAVALDPNDAGNHCALAYILAYESRAAEADAAFATALELDPNHAEAWTNWSDVSVLRGRPDEAIEQIRRALRLNPRPAGRYYWVLGNAQYAARQYQQAIETLRHEATYRTGSRRILAASLAQLGRMDEARQEAELFMVSNPHFAIGHWIASHPFTDDATRQHYLDGYRKAGLPE